MSPTKAEIQYELDLDGEAIMLVRDHLARAGVEAGFVDDAAMVAANRLVAAEEILSHAAAGVGVRDAAEAYFAKRNAPRRPRVSTSPNEVKG